MELRTKNCKSEPSDLKFSGVAMHVEDSNTVHHWKPHQEINLLVLLMQEMRLSVRQAEFSPGIWQFPEAVANALYRADSSSWTVHRILE